jgi:predicted nucleic acid-binding protein
MADILRVVGSVVVTQFTAATEARWVGCGRLSDARSEVEVVDLQPLVQERLIIVEDIRGDDEAARFVDLAMLMDDGEALAGAIAISRGLTLGTDDLRAIGIFAKVCPDLSIVSTPSLVRRWYEAGGVPKDELRNTIQDSRARGRFFPRNADPLADWWRANQE